MANGERFRGSFKVALEVVQASVPQRNAPLPPASAPTLVILPFAPIQRFLKLNNKGYNVKSATDFIFNLSNSSSTSPKYTNAQLMEFSNCSFALIIGKITLNTAKQTINFPVLLEFLRQFQNLLRFSLKLFHFVFVSRRRHGPHHGAGNR